jgi:hypothetical protein
MAGGTPRLRSFRRWVSYLSCRFIRLLLSIIGQSRQTTNDKKTCWLTFVYKEDERWAYCSRHGYIGRGRILDD